MNETVNENSWIPLMVVACATFIWGGNWFCNGFNCGCCII